MTTTFDDCPPLDADWNSLRADDALGLFRLDPTLDHPVCRTYNTRGQEIDLYGGRGLLYNSKKSAEGSIIADEYGAMWLQGRLASMRPRPVPENSIYHGILEYVPYSKVTHVRIVDEVKELLEATIWAADIETLKKFRGVPIVGFARGPKAEKASPAEEKLKRTKEKVIKEIEKAEADEIKRGVRKESLVDKYTATGPHMGCGGEERLSNINWRFVKVIVREGLEKVAKDCTFGWDCEIVMIPQ